MRMISLSAVLVGVLVAASPALGQERLILGGDIYSAGSRVVLSEPAPRDVVMSGASVDVTARAEGDALLGGFNIDVEAPIGKDLYAAGFSVNVEQPIGEDMTAAGFNVRVRRGAVIGGNARLLGGSINLDGQVAGSVLAAGGSVRINSVIGGDVRVATRALSFGPDARINGMLTYSAPEPIEIADNVIAAERVLFQKLEAPSASQVIDSAVREPLRGFWPSFLGVTFGFVVTIAFLTLLAAALLALAPVAVERVRRETVTAPFRSLGLGVLTLGALVGLVPVAAITIIGIPLIPVVVLTIVAMWIVGYLLGVYVVAWRIAGGFRDLAPNNGTRLIVILIGLVAAAVLNFIPFLGWLLNLALVLLGMGGIAAQLLTRLSRPAAPQPEMAQPIG